MKHHSTKPQASPKPNKLLDTPRHSSSLNTIETSNVPLSPKSIVTAPGTSSINTETNQSEQKRENKINISSPKKSTDLENRNEVTFNQNPYIDVLYTNVCKILGTALMPFNVVSELSIRSYLPVNCIWDGLTLVQRYISTLVNILKYNLRFTFLIITYPVQLFHQETISQIGLLLLNLLF
ncbi:hypothetical protein CDIK_4226, partial [Cucumispora dikerogammari]